MKLTIIPYNTLKQKIKQCIERLKLPFLQSSSKKKNVGRPLSIAVIDILTLGVYRAEHGIETKKDLFNQFSLSCCYKTLVCNLNSCALWILMLITMLTNENRKEAHLVKFTDATDVPVCLNKNAKHHQTMAHFAKWGKTGKGWFYGLKWHVTVDAHIKILSFCFTAGNVNDRAVFMKLNQWLQGIFVADAGYVSKKRAEEFYREGIRILFTKPLRKMKKLATKAQNNLYTARARIESVFRHTKMFEGLVSSLCRSEAGYFAHYFYAIAAFMLKDVGQNRLLLN